MRRLFGVGIRPVHGSSFDSFAFRNPVVTLGFKFERESFVAGLHDAAIVEHVDKIGDDEIQQPLIMRDDSCAPSGLFSLLTPPATMRSASMSRPESVSSRMASFGSSTAIWKISLRFFRRGEALVDRALQQFVAQFEQLHLFFHERKELHCVKFGLALVSADFVSAALRNRCCSHREFRSDTGTRGTGLRGRALRGRGRANSGRCKSLRHWSLRNRRDRPALRQCAFATAVRSHDSVNLAALTVRLTPFRICLSSTPALRFLIFKNRFAHFLNSYLATDEHRITQIKIVFRNKSVFHLCESVLKISPRCPRDSRPKVSALPRRIPSQFLEHSLQKPFTIIFTASCVESPR